MKTTLLTATALATLLALGCGPQAAQSGDADSAATQTGAADTHGSTEQAADTAADTGMDATADHSADPAGAADDAANGDTPTEEGTDDVTTTEPAAGEINWKLEGAAWTPEEEAKATKDPSGLKMIVVREGAGEGITHAQTGVMNYSGWLVDGTAFDSNVDPQFGHVTPFTLRAGNWGVIQGWMEGVKGMKKGEVRKLHIPAAMAYGERSPSPKIPANSDLVFLIELVDIQ